MAKILPAQINNKEEVEGDYTVGKLLKVGSAYKLGVQVADVDALEAADAPSKDTVPAPKELLDDRVSLLTGTKVADEGLDRIVESDGSFAQLAALEAKKDEAQKSIATIDAWRTIFQTTLIMIHVWLFLYAFYNRSETLYFFSQFINCFKIIWIS